MFTYPDNEEIYRRKYLDECIDFIAPAYRNINNFSKDYFDAIKICPSVVFKHGAFFMGNLSSKYVSCHEGIRKTYGNPKIVSNSIFMLGPSNIFSVFSEDKHTIPSFLRDICNRNNKFMNYNILNYGLTSADFDYYNLQLQVLPIHSDDIVILMSHTGSYGGFTKDHILEYLVYFNNIINNKGAKFIYFLRPELDRMINLSDREKRLLGGYESFFTSSFIDEQKSKKYLPPIFINQAVCEGISAFDLQPVIERPHLNGELFVDRTHFGPAGNKVIAQAIFDRCLSKIQAKPNVDLIRSNCNKLVENLFKREVSKNTFFIEWLNEIKHNSKFCNNDLKKIGSIVMNANPFTNGHKFLINYALKIVDYLYIFIVEENCSFFSFEDRFIMVKAGTKEFEDRVEIFPSGKFIISSFTFPEYFQKSEFKSDDVDSSYDVTFFAAVIAKELKIKFRFVGDEPFCRVTKQYNSWMRSILDKFGIQFIEIKRKEYDHTPISASSVRNLLKDGNIGMLKNIVPKSTLLYIMKRYEALKASNQL